MSDDALSFPGMDQFQQLPHLKQWLGLIVAGSVELGHIVESPVIRSATSIVPLGWSGHPGEGITEPFKVDVAGFGLHVCSLVHAQVNGIWYGIIYLFGFTVTWIFVLFYLLRPSILISFGSFADFPFSP